jgi:hypothetical protein
MKEVKTPIYGMGKADPIGYTISYKSTSWDKVLKFFSLSKVKNWSTPKKKTFNWHQDQPVPGYTPPKNEVDTAKLIIAMDEEAKKTTEQPFSRSYNSFSGIDIKGFWTNEDHWWSRTSSNFEEHSEKFKVISELQGFSFKAKYWPKGVQTDDTLSETTGTLQFITFDRSVATKLPWYKNIVFCAANEFGALAWMMFQDVTYDTLSYSINIDSIVSEEHIIFTAKQILPWRSLN